MAKLSELNKFQFDFTAAIRDPEHAKKFNNIPTARLAIYQSLLFNNFDSIFKSAFPVFTSILSDALRRDLIREFMIKHRATHELFHQIPNEMLMHMENTCELPLPLFALELAHYECMELTLLLSAVEIPTHGIDKQGDLFSAPPVFSPLAHVFCYQFPVHKLSDTYQPKTPPAVPTYLVIARDRQDAIRFMEINQVTARMISLMLAQPTHTGEMLLTQIANEMQATDVDMLLDAGLQAMQQLQREDMILGTRSVYTARI